MEFAERAGNRYKIWLKWSGYDELTWRWAHELRKEHTPDSEISREMEAAIAKEKVRVANLHSAPPDEDALVEPMEEPIVPQDLEPQGQEGPEGHISSRLRNRRPLAAVLDCSLATMTQLNATLDYECDLARAIPWYDDSDNTVHMNWCVEHAIARMPWQRGG